MKRLICTAAVLALAGCAVAQDRDTEIVAGSPGDVSVRAADGVDPAPVAAAHCSQYGKTAVRRLAMPIPDGSAPGMAIYMFGCQ